MGHEQAFHLQLTRIPTDRFAASEAERMRLRLKLEQFEAFSGPFNEIYKNVVPAFMDNTDAFLATNLAEAFSQMDKAGQRFNAAITRLSETIHQHGFDREHYFSSAIEHPSGIRNIVWSLSDIEERLHQLSRERIRDFLNGVHDALYTFIEEPLLDFESGFSNFKSAHTFSELIRRIPMINDERNIIGEKILYVGQLIGHTVEQ